MEKIILITNKLYKYRAYVYEEFISLFEDKNIFFKVVVAVDCEFDSFGLPNDRITYTGSNLKELKKCLDKEKPKAIINFLHPTNLSIWFVYWYSGRKKIPNIYWNHGVNLQDPKNKVKLLIYKFLHNFSDAIILYSKNELRFIKKKHHQKTFIANNTINFKKIPEITGSKKKLKEKHNVQFEKYVLFVGRIQERKRLDVLIRIFQKKEFENFGLLIVGPGFNHEYEKLIGESKNIIYLGSIYDDIHINEIFKLSDLFCIPGTNGLGVNQAMYWGLPCLALDVRHSPEIIYVEQNKTGFIVKDEDELATYLKLMLTDDQLLKKFSENAKKNIIEKASVEGMFQGFLKAIEYVNGKM